LLAVRQIHVRIDDNRDDTATTDGSRRHPSSTFRDGPIHATSVIAQLEKRKVGSSILPLTTSVTC
jgi:hypothetical protein